MIHRKNNRSGFSLIEILVVVAIASSIILVVSNFGTNTNGLNTLISQQLQSKSDVNQTLQIMTTEIRSAGPSQNGSYPIDSASTSSFAFYSDINKNGTIEHVRYFFATSTLYKGVIQATGTPATYPTSSEVITDLIDNVKLVATSTPIFQYFDTNYTGSQSPLPSPIVISSIRLVNISFYSTPTNSQQPQYFSILVDIRNLRSN